MPHPASHFRSVVSSACTSLAAAAALLCLSAAHAQPVLITEPQTINPGATTITPTNGGAPIPLATAQITVRGTTFTINGRHNLASLRLEINPTTRVRGIVTHDPNFTFDYSNGAGTDIVNGLSLILTGDVFVDTTCEIDVTGKGFPQNSGPGAGATWADAQRCGGTGGSHGGRGGSSWTPPLIQVQLPPPAYGSTTQPTTFGSGGGRCETGGAGGGCVRIQTPARVIVEGFIRADGECAPMLEYPGGSGAGGSIWIQAGLLAGRGQVIASGGNTTKAGVSTSTESGSGAGGRVRLESCASGLAAWNAAAGGSNCLAYNGALLQQIGLGGSFAENGTISSQATAVPFVLRTDRHFCAGDSVTLNAASSLTGIVAVQWFKDGLPLADSATITGSGTNSLTFSSLQASDNGLYEPRIQSTCGTFMMPGTRFTVGVPMITRLSTATTPVPFVDSAIAYDRDRQKLVSFGGISGVDASGFNIASNQTWEFDGATWTRRVMPSPPAVWGAGMAYDEHRRVCVLVGGLGNPYIWEWDGSDAGWQQRPFPFGSTSAYLSWGAWIGPAVAYDPVRRVTVIYSGSLGIFHGRSDGGFFGVRGGKVWEWDGTTTREFWPNVSRRGDDGLGAPVGMNGARLVYDRARNQMLLFGGMMNEGSSNDLWSWNGTTWTRVATEGPTRRWLHGMTYDEARQRVIVWGGIDRARGLGDIWEWDGQAWSRVMGNVAALVGHGAAAVAYFPPSGTTYRFGGALAGTQSQITTYSPAAGFISGQPQSVAACLGSSASFNVNLAFQSGMSYQWRKNGTPITAATNPSATTATLVIPSVQNADVASYDCIITNSCGSVTSDPAALALQSCGGCSLADIAGGGDDGLSFDGIVDGNDFVAFINSFSTGDPATDPLADVAGGGDDGLSPDGIIDGNDFVAFINAFAAGC